MEMIVRSMTKITAVTLFSTNMYKHFGSRWFLIEPIDGTHGRREHSVVVGAWLEATVNKNARCSLP